jgi:hypothetical protein
MTFAKFERFKRFERLARFVRIARRERLPSTAVVVALAFGACGGGTPFASASGSAGGAVPAGTRADRALVRVFDPLSLTAVLTAHGSSLIRPISGTTFFLVSVPAAESAAAFVSQLEADARVAAAELDLGLKAPEGTGSTIPAGGTLLAEQIPNQPELLRVGAAAARARVTGPGVRVAVIDTGILSSLNGVSGHVDGDGYDFLDGDSDPTDGQNGLDDDGDGLIDELYAHGTFVASLIVAVAPQARIVPFRVLDADGVGTSSGVASAITFAASHGVAVINLSVAIPPEVQVVREAIDSARLSGVQVVEAAGNTGAEDASSPAPADGVLVVTSVDPDDVRADFASYGSAVSMSAPGVDLQGAYPMPPGTARWSGTSFSAALVSGGYALLKQQRPLWTPDQIATRLRASAVPIDGNNPGAAGRLGSGRLDLDAATAAP